MTTTGSSTSTLADDAASVLPEPGEIGDGAATSNASADDLISRLADEQIDGLLDAAAPVDDEAATAVEAALQAASESPQIAGPLVRVAAAELDAELAQIEAGRSAPAGSMEANFEEVHTAETEAEVPPAAPSFNPPPHAEVDALEQAAVEAIAPHADAAVVAEASAAEAVARELAADVAMLSTPLPSVVAHEAAVPFVVEDAWWKRAIAALLSVPTLLLAAINLPVRPMGDRGREIIGAAGVVTLVNAAGLLIYLMAFAHRH